MRKIVFSGLFVALLASFSMGVFAAAPTGEEGDIEQAQARPGTLLPNVGGVSTADCEAAMKFANANFEEVREAMIDRDKVITIPVSGASSLLFTANDFLGCGIKTGDISLWMVPYYIRYVLEFVLGIAGLVAVGGIVYGGFVYLFAGFSDDKDKGKKAIMYGLAGMVITMVAWAFVNILIAVFTS